MGGAKREMENHDHKIAVAISIAARAKALEYCDAHETPLEGSADAQEAYKLGNHMFSSGELEGVFEDRREMTDYIKNVVDENYGGECYACAKIRDE